MLTGNVSLGIIEYTEWQLPWLPMILVTVVGASVGTGVGNGVGGYEVGYGVGMRVAIVQ
jgi:hypothetical protein